MNALRELRESTRQLLAAGHDVVWTGESEDPGDEKILAHAYSEQRIVVTLDKDFGELVYRLKKAHHGIILIRLAGYHPLDKADIVVKILSKHKIELLNAFTVIQANAVRIRK